MDLVIIGLLVGGIAVVGISWAGLGLRLFPKLFDATRLVGGYMLD